MKFVGGPMHGCDVPDELPRFTLSNGTVVVRVLVVGEPRSCAYAQQDWFVAPGKPLIPYFACIGTPIEKLLRVGKRVLEPL